MSEENKEALTEQTETVVKEEKQEKENPVKENTVDTKEKPKKKNEADIKKSEAKKYTRTDGTSDFSSKTSSTTLVSGKVKKTSKIVLGTNKRTFTRTDY